MSAATESERLSPRARAGLLQPRRRTAGRALASFALTALLVLAIAAIYIGCIWLACIHR